MYQVLFILSLLCSCDARKYIVCDDMYCASWACVAKLCESRRFTFVDKCVRTNDVCAPCGKIRERCCPWNTCMRGSRCIDGTCVSSEVKLRIKPDRDQFFIEEDRRPERY